MASIQGKLQQVLSPVSGEGKNGNWKYVPIVIQTTGDYPKQVCIEVWDKQDKSHYRNAEGDYLLGTCVNIGDIIEVEYSPESRNWNDKWFTSVRAYSISVASHYEGQTQLKEQKPSDDLPF